MEAGIPESHTYTAADDPALIQIAIAIAEQSATDWTRALSSRSAASNELRHLVEQLRVVDRLVRAHETLRASPSVSFDTSGAAPAPSDVRQLPEVRWGSLIVREKIGSGSFGAVYRAWDPRLDREVALKIIDGDSAAPDAVVDEARTLARVHHPNVVAVHGAERIEGRTGIWMEFIRGRSLAQEVDATGSLKFEETARIGVDVCRALAAVHAAGLLHRDIKVQNVIRETSGRIVLGDFGTTVERRNPPDAGSTRIAGTPLYLAPELFSGAPASVASELYSVGVLLYFLCTGAFPVTGRTAGEIRDAHLQHRRVAIRQLRPDVPLALGAMIERLLALNPGKRYPSAEAVAAELSQWLEQRSVGWPQRHALVLSVAAVVAAICIAWAALPVARRALDGDRRGIVGGVAARLIPDAPCAGAPTADGEWIACLIRPRPTGNQPSLQRLVMFGVRTAETRELWRSDTADTVWHPTVSPDGEDIAVAVPTPSSEGQPREIRRFNISTREWTTIATLPANTLNMIMSTWSRADDRLEVYLLRQEQASFAFALLSPRTGELEIVFEFPVMPSGWWRSGDGRWLTYSASDGEIRVCDLHSGSARERPCAPVASHPATDFLPFISPDGALLFSSDRSGTIALWRVALGGIHQRGTPTLVRDTGRERLVPVAFDESGALFYRLEAGASDVLQVDLDTPGAQVRGSLTPPIRVSRAPAWSTDGSHIAYIASLGNHTGGAALQLVVQQTQDRVERTFELPGARFNSARTAWSPDDRFIAIRGVGLGGGSGEIGVHLVDPRTGLTGRVLRRTAPEERSVFEQIGDIDWLDSRTVVFSRGRGVGTFDIATGREGTLWTAPPSARVINLAVSPDRRWLALTLVCRPGEPSIVVVPATGSPIESGVLHLQTPGWVQSWTPDGAVLVTRSTNSATGRGASEVWRVPLNGVEPTALGVKAEGLYEVHAHPDGKRLAISIDALRSEFFVGLGR